MSLDGSYSEALHYPHHRGWGENQASLMVKADGWCLFHTMPGPDRRYNDDHEIVSGEKLQDYLEQISNGWKQYVKAKQSLAATGKYYAKVAGPHSVSLLVSEEHGGLMLDGPAVLLEEKEQVEDVLKYLLATASRAEEISALLRNHGGPL